MSVRAFTVFAAVAVIMIAGGAISSSGGDSQEIAKGRTILFVDDHDVLYRSGTKRVLRKPKRQSDKALIELAKPWEVAIGYTSVDRDPTSGTYQLWYQAYAGARAGYRRSKSVVCYAESKDGIRFTRPDLDLFPYKDEKST